MKDQLAQLSDQALIQQIKSLVGSEREITVRVIEHLAEGVTRGLFVKIGYPSLPLYCRNVLRYSEHEAYLRTAVAFCAIRFPVVLERFADGSVTMTAINILSKHLTEENHLELLERARGKTKFQVKEIVAGIDPKAPVAPMVWEVGQVDPLAPNLYKFEFTGGESTKDKLYELRDLLKHRIPTGDIGVVFDTALTIALEEVTKQRIGVDPDEETTSVQTDSSTTRDVTASASLGVTPLPSTPKTTNSRHIPKHIRRKVWRRDGGQCAYRAPDGNRCASTGKLEFHHVKPYAWGGKATVHNIELRCRAHNAFEGAALFGKRHEEQRE